MQSADCAVRARIVLLRNELPSHLERIVQVIAWTARSASAASAAKHIGYEETEVSG